MQILVHTTGEPGMNLLDKIIYIADYIEPGRDKAEKSPGCPAALLSGSGCGTVKDPQRYSRLLKEHR